MPATPFIRGVKYRFQYVDPDGDTLLQFDDLPYHPDVGHHHRHTPDGEIEPLEFTGIRDFAAEFLDEVTTLCEQQIG